MGYSHGLEAVKKSKDFTGETRRNHEAAKARQASSD
jgi:hypothetical protein